MQVEASCRVGGARHESNRSDDSGTAMTSEQNPSQQTTDCDEVPSTATVAVQRCRMAVGSEPCRKKQRKLKVVDLKSLLSLTPMQDNLCMVCGDDGAGRHFGVVTCEACKAFYRRRSKIDKRQKSDSGPCHVRHMINKHNRNECQSCRYDKCIRLGMSRDNCIFGKPPKKPKHGDEAPNAVDTILDIRSNSTATTTTAQSANNEKVVDQLLSDCGLIFQLEPLDDNKHLLSTNCVCFLNALIRHMKLNLGQEKIAMINEVAWAEAFDILRSIRSSQSNYGDDDGRRLTNAEKAMVLSLVMMVISNFCGSDCMLTSFFDVMDRELSNAEERRLSNMRKIYFFITFRTVLSDVSSCVVNPLE